MLYLIVKASVVNDYWGHVDILGKNLITWNEAKNRLESMSINNLNEYKLIGINTTSGSVKSYLVEKEGGELKFKES